MTGVGGARGGSYVLKGTGWAMRPDSGGYHKRLDFFASPSGVQRQAEKQIDSSHRPLLKAHELLTTRPHPDERALAMYRAATSAIEAFARENQGDLGRFTFAKLTSCARQAVLTLLSPLFNPCSHNRDACRLWQGMWQSLGMFASSPLGASL